jgi:hypothetical protein
MSFFHAQPCASSSASQASRDQLKRYTAFAQPQSLFSMAYVGAAQCFDTRPLYAEGEDEYKHKSLKEILEEFTVEPLHEETVDDFDQLMKAPIIEEAVPPSSVLPTSAAASLAPRSSDFTFDLDQPYLISPANSLDYDPAEEEEPTNHKKRRRSSLSSTTSTTPRFRTYQAEHWSTKFDELCAYHKKHGNCLVPHNYQENLSLARWVKRQRYQYKLHQDNQVSTMTDNRIMALNHIGFCWDSQAACWGERLDELKRYHQVHGNCNVPSVYAKNPQLATWVKCQRRQYKLFHENAASNITLARIVELEKLGFEWELRSHNKNKKQKTAATTTF